MGRRICLTLLGFALTSSADEWNIAYQPSDVTSATGRPLSGEVVDHLDTVTASLRRMDDHLGSGQTLGLVCQHLATVVEVLRERRYTDSVGRRLHGTAGEFDAPRGLAVVRRQKPQPGATVLDRGPLPGPRRR